MNRRRIYIWCGLATSCVALVGWVLLPKPIAVESATVARMSFEQSVDEQARTRIRDHYVVTAPLGGQIDRIALREGDVVGAGTTIARLRPVLPALLDSRTELELRRRTEAARAAKEAADARVARVQVALLQARREVERSRKLAESKLVAAAKLENDELSLQLATHEVESAAADAHVAQHEIDLAVAAQARIQDGARGNGVVWPLVAPIGGRVLRVQQRSSGAVSVATPLVELGDPANLEVLIELLTTEAPLVVAGAPVRLSNWGGATELQGRVRLIEPQGYTKISALGVEEQRVNVIVDIVSPPKDWQALGEGYRLDAHIRVYRQDQALTVPTGALLRVGAQWSVYQITDRQRARLVTVKVGHRNDRFAEVLDGLKPGDRIVVYPGDTLHEGARVVAAASVNEVQIESP